MITSKQRRFLRSMAHELDPVIFIGKAGITENVIRETDQCLEARELVKFKVQEGCQWKAEEAADLLRSQVGAEFVQAIGRKFTLYRESKEKKQIILP